jgi:hypothetical protein
MRSSLFAGLLLVLGLLALTVSPGAQEATIVTGTVSASDHEAAEGYFVLGADTTLVAKPGSALHGWLLRHKGEKVSVSLQSMARP